MRGGRDDVVGVKRGGSMRGAEVEDSLGRGNILDVAVLEEGAGAVHHGVLAGHWTGIVILYRVLQAVGTEYPAVLLAPGAGQVLGLGVLL